MHHDRLKIDVSICPCFNEISLPVLEKTIGGITFQQLYIKNNAVKRTIFTGIIFESKTLK